MTDRPWRTDGKPAGILLAESNNWSGKVLVAPRSQLDQLSKREEGAPHDALGPRVHEAFVPVDAAGATSPAA